MSVPNVGCHLIMWRVQDESSLISALDDIAAAGYAGIEGGGMPFAERLQELLDERNLSWAASHTGVNRLQDGLETEIESVKALGARFLCVSGGRHESADEYRKVGEALQKAGEQCRKEGVDLCYHNHAHEIENGLFGLKHILEPTSPTDVHLCLDTYWVAKGGEDPLAVLRQYRDRTPYPHFKDMRDGDFAEIGQGSLDWKAIAQELETWDLPWVMVEQDRTTRTPAESAGLSRAFLRDQIGW